MARASGASRPERRARSPSPPAPSWRTASPSRGPTVGVRAHVHRGRYRQDGDDLVRLEGDVGCRLVAVNRDLLAFHRCVNSPTGGFGVVESDSVLTPWP